MSPNPRDVENSRTGIPDVPSGEEIDLASVAEDLEQEPEEKVNLTDGADGTDGNDGTDET